MTESSGRRGATRQRQCREKEAAGSEGRGEEWRKYNADGATNKGSARYSPGPGLEAAPYPPGGTFFCSPPVLPYPFTRVSRSSHHRSISGLRDQLSNSTQGSSIATCTRANSPTTHSYTPKSDRSIRSISIHSPASPLVPLFITSLAPLSAQQRSIGSPPGTRT